MKNIGKFSLCHWQVILVFILLYLIALVILFIPHKEVSDSYKKEFSEMTFFSNENGTERISYVPDNTDALMYRLQMFDAAQEEIILSTFDFNCDESGKDIMAALLHAADRGVRVRVIVDGFSGLMDMKGNPYFLALASHENIELKRYNPINFLKPWNLQARLHDKYIIIDNSMYLLGGRNTMDLFLGDYSDSKNLDRELFVYNTVPEERGATENLAAEIPASENLSAEQSSLMQLRNYFENIWSLKESKPFLCSKKTTRIAEKATELRNRYDTLKSTYPAIQEEWDWMAITIPANKITLLSNPVEAANKEPHMWYAVSRLLKDGKNIRIYTPYIICGDEMYSDLTEICAHADSVEILTNDVASGANPWGCTDYLNQQDNIRATGVTVYEYLGSHSCHTKAYVIDDRLTLLGSYNLDMRSTYLDTELMLAVDCPELNALIRSEFEKDKSYSRTMTASGEYSEGENYKGIRLSTAKQIFYSVLRVLIIPIRKFL